MIETPACRNSPTSSEDQHLGVGEHRLGDLDHLLLGPGQPADACLRFELEAEPAEHLERLLAHATTVDEPGANRLATEEDVLLHRQLGHQAEFLEHGADAELARLVRGQAAHGLSLIGVAAAIGAQDARDDVDDGRLAGAVLAEENVDLAGRDLQIHPVERAHPGEGLHDPLKLDARDVGRRRGLRRDVRLHRRTRFSGCHHLAGAATL
jgi:hypothetical protein